jgi:hypothetical protein
MGEAALPPECSGRRVAKAIEAVARHFANNSLGHATSDVTELLGSLTVQLKQDQAKRLAMIQVLNEAIAQRDQSAVENLAFWDFLEQIAELVHEHDLQALFGPVVENLMRKLQMPGIEQRSDRIRRLFGEE